MRILFFTTDLSFPPQDGRMLRTYNVLRELAGRHSIHLVCFDQRHGEDPDDRRRVAETELRRLCESVDVFEIPSKRSALSLAWTGVASLVDRSPFSCRVYRSRTVMRRLEALASDRRIDVLHVENTLLGDQVDRVHTTARVLMHHNVESHLFLQRAESDTHIARRAFTWLEASKMRLFESEMGPRFGVHIACSEEDARRLGKIVDGAQVLVVPNGVDLEYFSPGRVTQGEKLDVVHIGGLNWQPNLHGARWLVEKVWPLVQREVPQARLLFVGRTGEAPIARWQAQGVGCRGEVEDVRPYFSAATMSVVPVHVGGGTRLKILNSWAMGTPIVSTSKGCEGLLARHQENMLVADTPEAFATSIVSLLRTPALCAALASAGRKLVEAEYGWARIAERIENAYRVASEPSAQATARRNAAP